MHMVDKRYCIVVQALQYHVYICMYVVIWCFLGHRDSRYLWGRLSEVEGLDLLGPPPNASGDNRNPLLAFNSRDVHAHDLSFFMDQVSYVPEVVLFFCVFSPPN